MLHEFKGAVRLPLVAAILLAINSRAFEGKKLPAITKDLEDIPEAARGLYEKTGDDYVLVVDDSPFKAKLKEFRDNNIGLLKAKEDLEGKLEALKGVDPAEYSKMKKQLEEMEDKTLIDDGKIDELVALRTERMRKDFESQAAKLTEAKESAEKSSTENRTRLEKVLIDSQISQAVTGKGTVRKGAMPDILSRAKETWRLDDDGNPVAVNQDGSKRYGKDGSKPLSMDEWAGDLLNEAGFLFEGSSGGGSGNNDRAGKGAPVGTIFKSDRRGFSRSLEDIAKGKVHVASD